MPGEANPANLTAPVGSAETSEPEKPAAVGGAEPPEPDKPAAVGGAEPPEPDKPAAADGAEPPAGGNGGGSPPRATIDAASAGEVKDVEKLDPVRQAGMRLAAGVGLLISVVTLMIAAHWMATAPWTGVPPHFSEMKTADGKALVENLKSISDIAADRSIKLFDAIVSRALLPVFTAILGYIFGSRTASANQKQQG
jgi:hypothetical protein